MMKKILVTNHKALRENGDQSENKLIRAAENVGVIIEASSRNIDKIIDYIKDNYPDIYNMITGGCEIDNEWFWANLKAAIEASKKSPRGRDRSGLTGFLTAVKMERLALGHIYQAEFYEKQAAEYHELYEGRQDFPMADSLPPETIEFFKKLKRKTVKQIKEREAAREEMLKKAFKQKLLLELYEARDTYVGIIEGKGFASDEEESSLRNEIRALEDKCSEYLKNIHHYVLIDERFPKETV